MLARDPVFRFFVCPLVRKSNLETGPFLLCSLYLLVFLDIQWVWPGVCDCLCIHSVARGGDCGFYFLDIFLNITEADTGMGSLVLLLLLLCVLFIHQFGVDNGIECPVNVATDICNLLFRFLVSC